MGIQLDPEGWYSVTPEVIADHVAKRVGQMSRRKTKPPLPQSIPPTVHHHTMTAATTTTTAAAAGTASGGLIVLDAFCGCGGNAIAFAKLPADKISLVVSVDIDRSKLEKAAYNACLYDIPTNKIRFVEGSAVMILEHCYVGGQLCLERLRQTVQPLPPPVETKVSSGGFLIGGLGMLPGRIDAVFMDPPWGGVDYGTLGKDGYYLEKHMRIRKVPQEPEPSSSSSSNNNNGGGGGARTSTAVAMIDDFFDTLGTSTTKPARSAAAAASSFESSTTRKDEEEGDCYVNGSDLLKLAAHATSTRWVIYDIPRNTNKNSLAHSAWKAGYRGNLRLDEHYIHGQLKTVTAYLGTDHTHLYPHAITTGPPAPPTTTRGPAQRQLQQLQLQQQPHHHTNDTRKQQGPPSGATPQPQHLTNPPLSSASSKNQLLPMGHPPHGMPMGGLPNPLQVLQQQQQPRPAPNGPLHGQPPMPFYPFPQHPPPYAQQQYSHPPPPPLQQQQQQHHAYLQQFPPPHGFPPQPPPHLQANAPYILQQQQQQQQRRLHQQQGMHQQQRFSSQQQQGPPPM